MGGGQPGWVCGRDRPKDLNRFRGDLYRVAVIAGSPKEKSAAINSGADVLVTNFESAVSMEAQLKSLLRRRPGRCVLAIDESFFIKSLDAKRTRALRRLREWCGRSYVLCGTPAPNSPVDLVQQFNLVDFGLAFEEVELPTDRSEAAPVVQDVLDKRGLFTRADVPVRPAFRLTHNVGTREKSSFAAQWLAYTTPYRRFADALAGNSARFGANVGRYPFIVTDFHRSFLADNPAHEP